jgi:hypothetical protein
LSFYTFCRIDLVLFKSVEASFAFLLSANRAATHPCGGGKAHPKDLGRAGFVVSALAAKLKLPMEDSAERALAVVIYLH